MIKSYRNKQTEAVFNRKHSTVVPPHLIRAARTKLIMLSAASTLDSLKEPPNNKLEKLKGNRAGQYSIRINKKYRICFEWIDGNAENVEIVDYH